MDIISLYREGERASANFRMVVSYWDTAASLVLNGGIDQKMFLDETPSISSCMQRSPTSCPKCVNSFAKQIS
jgi:hypothetical protein